MSASRFIMAALPPLPGVASVLAIFFLAIFFIIGFILPFAMTVSV